jgi:hypothetical protein
MFYKNQLDEYGRRIEYYVYAALARLGKPAEAFWSIQQHNDSPEPHPKVVIEVAAGIRREFIVPYGLFGTGTPGEIATFVKNQIASLYRAA